MDAAYNVLRVPAGTENLPVASGEVVVGRRGGVKFLLEFIDLEQETSTFRLAIIVPFVTILDCQSFSISCF